MQHGRGRGLRGHEVSHKKGGWGGRKKQGQVVRPSKKGLGQALAPGDFGVQGQDWAEMNAGCISIHCLDSMCRVPYKEVKEVPMVWAGAVCGTVTVEGLESRGRCSPTSEMQVRRSVNGWPWALALGA